MADPARVQAKLSMLEREMHGIKSILAKLVDENRYLRLEVDVLREAVVGDAQVEESRSALTMIGRRAGTTKLKPSVCSTCLRKKDCFACNACRSVEYCSSQCQLKNFAAHVELCRHIAECGS